MLGLKYLAIFRWKDRQWILIWPKVDEHEIPSIQLNDIQTENEINLAIMGNGPKSQKQQTHNFIIVIVYCSN